MRETTPKNRTLESVKLLIFSTEVKFLYYKDSNNFFTYLDHST